MTVKRRRCRGSPPVGESVSINKESRLISLPSPPPPLLFFLLQGTGELEKEEWWEKRRKKKEDRKGEMEKG